MKTLLTIITFLFFIQCNGQIRHQRLVIAEFRIDTPRAGNFTFLVSYNFDNGNLKSKDTIFGAETFRKDTSGRYSRYVRFEFGKNFIYKNRYIISGSGNVIDIEKKKLVIEDGDDFVEAIGDTLIFHRVNSYTGTGFLMLNLKTGRYGFINSNKWDEDKSRRSSPDKKHYLSIDKTEIPYKICLHTLKGNKQSIVCDAGYGPPMFGGSQRPNIETYWLDNHSFLYAVHRVGNPDSSIIYASERFHHLMYLSTVTLRRFDIETKSDKTFFVIDSVRQGNTNGEFFIDGIGQKIYRTSGFNYFLVDTFHQTLVAYPFLELGNGFSVETALNPDKKTVRFNQLEIGNLQPSRKVVGKGIIAVEQGQNKINIWSDITKAWTSIEIPWINNFIGWIDEE